MDMALDCFLARMARACFDSARLADDSPMMLVEERDDDFCSSCFSMDWTSFMSQGGGLFLRKV